MDIHDIIHNHVHRWLVDTIMVETCRRKSSRLRKALPLRPSSYITHEKPDRVALELCTVIVSMQTRRRARCHPGNSRLGDSLFGSLSRRRYSTIRRDIQTNCKSVRFLQNQKYKNFSKKNPKHVWCMFKENVVGWNDKNWFYYS